MDSSAIDMPTAWKLLRDGTGECEADWSWLKLVSAKPILYFLVDIYLIFISSDSFLIIALPSFS